MRKKLLTPKEEVNQWLGKISLKKALSKARKLKRESQDKTLGWFHYDNMIKLLKDEKRKG